MELLNVITARSVWLFDLAELNPKGKSVFPELLDWLKDTYDFEKSPKSVDDVDETKALVFSRGHYQAKEEIFVYVVELKVYTDGLVANTQSSTKDTDAFLNDILTTSGQEFSLTYKSEMIRKRLYLSELNVRSQKNLGGVNPHLDDFASRISKAGGHQFEFAGLSFWPRQAIPPTAISAFTLERKVNTDRNENKYFSRAPLHTEDHFNLLQEIESVFMA
jgi:hypothetical protein